MVNDARSKRCGACGFVYYLNPSSAVACFIRDKEGRLLVVRRRCEPAKGTLDLPGGFAELDETLEEALQREVKEETGLTLRSFRYLFSLPNRYTFSGFVVHTLDAFFEGEVDTFDEVAVADDAAEALALTPDAISPEQFGLDSIRKALYKFAHIAVYISSKNVRKLLRFGVDLTLKGI